MRDKFQGISPQHMAKNMVQIWRCKKYTKLKYPRKNDEK
jgi:hypothetical protein